MKLTAAMTVGVELQAVCRSRHRRPDAHILSPLPNLRLDSSAAVAELVHHPLLEPMNGSGLAGSATLRLRGECLNILVTADRQVHIDLMRCKAASMPDRTGERGDLLLVVTACGRPRPGLVSSASFDLSLRGRFPPLAEADLKQLPLCDLDTLRPSALQGLATGGWPGERSPPRASAEGIKGASSDPAADLLASNGGTLEDAYFLGRIKDEIGAALRANEPGVASRHVQIATLMARRLQGRTPVTALEARRTG